MVEVRVLVLVLEYSNLKDRFREDLVLVLVPHRVELVYGLIRVGGSWKIRELKRIHDISSSSSSSDNSNHLHLNRLCIPNRHSNRDT